VPAWGDVHLAQVEALDASASVFGSLHGRLKQQVRVAA
jgi:hypothetical protein